MLSRKIRSVFNPSFYQGWGKTSKYFEGWYFKVVDTTEKYAFAFIPGIAMDENGKKQAFIQVLDGKRKTAVYHRFDASDFVPATDRFEVQIQQNKFSNNELALDLPGISVNLKFENSVPWPNPWYSPGIMGPYTFVPFMECYHGIVSMDHVIEGSINIDKERIDFSNGKGYIEKDWGRSFPSAYVWMQSNHFKQKNTSLKVSVAKIPWVRNSFVGFIAGLWLKDHLIQFTTYNKSKLVQSIIDKDQVELLLQNRHYKLEIRARRDDATSLASPILGFMDGRIEESMTSNIEVWLTDLKSNKVIFHDTGRNTGLEVAGKIDEIIIP